jgi:hypothetical protein
MAHIIWAWWTSGTPAHAADFYAIVGRNGAVLLCLAKGSILFSDRCAGEGRLTIVEPMREGTVVWRSVTGTVSLEPPNAGCAESRAKWDPKAENVISTGKKITKADRAAVLKRLSLGKITEGADLTEEDVTAFALDLDNDGKDEIVFVASNLMRVAKLWERDKQTRPYATFAGILPARTDLNYPDLFYTDHGDYLGGTDAIGSVVLEGVVSLSPGTGEIGLLVTAGPASDGKQTLIRYRYSSVQRIETIRFICG